MSENKPWNKVNKNDRSWFLSSNHNSKFRKDKDTEVKNDVIDAFIIVQDCNMAGEYQRIIAWKNEDRYFDVATDKNWYFSKKMDSLSLGTLVNDNRSELEYKVVYSERFYKVLEKC